MPAYNYFPLLKTTDAELRSFIELPPEVQRNILPIFELTKSRRSKKNPAGDCWKRVSFLKEHINRQPFILDLTTESSLQNPQIASMLNSTRNGFDLWVSFVRQIIDQELPVIPVIHFNPDELAEVKSQIKKLQRISGTLAFRVEIDDAVSEYVQAIGEVFELSNLILILDARYIGNLPVNPFPGVLDSIAVDEFKAVVCAASSFPSNVAVHGASKGMFPISEVTMTEELRGQYRIYHGDYGSIHPVRYEARWGGWVPRIDFPSGGNFYYYRYRREAGGYEKAAQSVVADRNYRSISQFDVWGDMEIASAAKGDPNGLSPSHWIAVRANLYMTQQYLRLNLKKFPKMTL